ncbi:MAG: hypothetical protein JRI93_04245 [Deltaproteobacteria bacterium]|nr:hypothetical protein [Deltaproteobacteria bacterium]
MEFEKGRNAWLFDIINDPQELDNLMGSSRGNSILPELKAHLEKLLSAIK